MSKLSGSFTTEIEGTADLSPPAVECQWEVEFDGDADFEKVLVGHYRKNYEDGLRRLVADQVRAFALPLASMQRDIDALRKARAALDSQTDTDAALAALERISGISKKSLPTLVGEYNDYLAKAVDNVRRQQVAAYGKTFEAQALEQARKSIRRDVRNKGIRHGTGITVRGVLMLGAAGAALATAVVTFGAALPALAAVALAGAALGGGTALITSARAIADVRDLERRSMNLLVKDAEAITAELEAVSTNVKGLGKHVNDVSMYYSRRREEMARLERGLNDFERQLAAAAADTERLRDAVPRVYKLQKARFADANARVKQARQAYADSVRRDADLKAALTAANALVSELGKIPQHGAKGIAHGLSRIDMKNPDTYLALADAVGGLMRAAGGAGKALSHL